MNRIRLISGGAAIAFAASLASPAFAGEVTGVVADASDTATLDAVEVVIEELGRRTVTARDGRYVFADVPEGTYTLTARYVGAQPVSAAVIVPAEGRVAQDFVLGQAGSQILVLGQTANQASALSRKRAADGISDVLTRDTVGQFPDQNVAESLRRLPGINVLNDQGEGRFVSVRGLDPELNATSLNGVRLPAPEADVRSVALDVISSDIIESIEVKKSLTPDMDADTIGASVEIKTTSAFDRRKDLLTVRLEGSYNRYSEELTPKASIDFATRVTDNFGISGGVSYYNRKFETDNVEADDWFAYAGGPVALDLQYRDYDVERERISGSLNFDVRAGENTELYLRGVWSQFDDQEYRRRVRFNLGRFEDDGPSSQNGTTAVFDDADQRVEVRRDIKDRFERQRIQSVVLGGESRFDNLFAEYSVSWAKSLEIEPSSVDPAEFRRRFSNTGLSVAIDYADPRVPLYSATGNPAFFDPAAYSFNDLEYVNPSDTEDEEWAGRFDFGIESYLDNGTLTVQAGVKARRRVKTYAYTVDFYEYDGPGTFTLADVLGSQIYRLTGIDPVPSYTGASDFFAANFAQFVRNDLDSRFDSNAEDYRAEEDITAGYMLGRFESDSLLVIGGVRYERTSNRLFGNQVTLFAEGATLPGGAVATQDTVEVTPLFFTRQYGDWLPSVTLRYEAQPDLILRAAAYRSLVRPRLSSFAPRFLVEVNDDDQISGEFGNPALVPYKAWNFDASVEYYLSGNGGVSAGFFYKDVKDFIVNVEIDTPGTFNGTTFDEAVIPINGRTATIWGLEFSYTQSLDFLPGLLSGLLVQANYTYTDATGSVPVGGFTDLDTVTDYRDIDLPASSKHTFNTVLGYEKGPVSLRLAGTYRDGYLDEINSDAALDRYVDDHFQLDFTARFNVTRNVQLYYDWININNAKYFAYNRLAGGRNLYQYEEYSWTMKGGVRVTF